MRKYITHLKTKPEKHRRRFALLVSSAFTLSIFTIWSFVNFGPARSLVAESEGGARVEPSPFYSLKIGVATAINAIKGDFREAENTLELQNFQSNGR